MKTKTPKISDQWDLKYFREGWTFPFGSVCNAYAQVFAGKVENMMQFLEDMEAIAQFSQRLINDKLDVVAESHEMPVIDNDALISTGSDQPSKHLKELFAKVAKEAKAQKQQEDYEEISKYEDAIRN